MEERLDDAINVLRNHAESVGGGGPQSALPGTGPSPALSHSNGIMAAYPPVLEPLMVFFMLYNRWIKFFFPHALANV